jgi:uncharacterized protein
MSLEQLWRLQEIDLTIKALENEVEHTPLHGELQEMTVNVAQLTETLAGDEESTKALRKRLRSLELDLQKNSDSRVALRKRLYGGEVANVRELEQMEIKLGLLEKEQSAREEETLELMETIESDEEQLQGQSRALQEAEKALQAKEGQLADTLDRIEKELAALREQREEASAKIEPQLLERYHLLAQKHQGRGLARVIHDICGGCRVFISSAQQGHLYNPQAMVYCESCGRLLVKLSEQSETS